MAPEEKARLLALHQANSLSGADRLRLMDAALTDQEIFDAMMDRQVFLSIQDDPILSRGLRYALRENPVWYRRPLAWTVLAGATAALAVLLVVRPWSVGRLTVPTSGDRLPASSMLSVEGSERPNESELRDRLMSLFPKQTIGGSLGLNKSPAVYRVGEPIRIAFQAKQDANAILLESRSDRTLARLFPNRFVSSTSVRAGAKILIPPPGQGDMKIEGSSGVRRLRLVLVPTDVDVFSRAAVEVAIRENRISIIDLTYTVN